MAFDECKQHERQVSVEQKDLLLIYYDLRMGCCPKPRQDLVRYRRRVVAGDDGEESPSSTKDEKQDNEFVWCSVRDPSWELEGFNFTAANENAIEGGIFSVKDEDDVIRIFNENDHVRSLRVMVAQGLSKDLKEYAHKVAARLVTTIQKNAYRTRRHGKHFLQRNFASFHLVGVDLGALLRYGGLKSYFNYTERLDAKEDRSNHDDSLEVETWLTLHDMAPLSDTNDGGSSQQAIQDFFCRKEGKLKITITGDCATDLFGAIMKGLRGNENLKELSIEKMTVENVPAFANFFRDCRLEVFPFRENMLTPLLLRSFCKHLAAGSGCKRILIGGGDWDSETVHLEVSENLAGYLGSFLSKLSRTEHLIISRLRLAGFASFAALCDGLKSLPSLRLLQVEQCPISGPTNGVMRKWMGMISENKQMTYVACEFVLPPQDFALGCSEICKQLPSEHELRVNWCITRGGPHLIVSGPKKKRKTRRSKRYFSFNICADHLGIDSSSITTSEQLAELIGNDYASVLRVIRENLDQQHRVQFEIDGLGSVGERMLAMAASVAACPGTRSIGVRGGLNLKVRCMEMCLVILQRATSRLHSLSVTIQDTTWMHTPIPSQLRDIFELVRSLDSFVMGRDAENNSLVQPMEDFVRELVANQSLLTVKTRFDFPTKKFQPMLHFVPVRNRVRSVKHSSIALLPALSETFTMECKTDSCEEEYDEEYDIYDEIEDENSRYMNDNDYHSAPGTEATFIETDYGKRNTALFMLMKTFADQTGTKASKKRLAVGAGAAGR